MHIAEKKNPKKKKKGGRGRKNNIIYLFTRLLKNQETGVNLTNEIPSQIS